MNKTEALAGVKVKPLEWLTEGDVTQNTTGICSYKIEHWEGGGFGVYLHGYIGLHKGQCDTLEAAKAAAQADYEARILAILASPEREEVDTVQVGWAYQDAKWDKDRWHPCGLDSRPRPFEGRRIEPIFVNVPVTPSPDREEVEPHPLAKFGSPSVAPLGLYRVHWKSGGTSLAAIGMMENGNRWIAPTNWVRPGTMPSSGEWAEIDVLEPIYPDATPSPDREVERLRERVAELEKDLKHMRDRYEHWMPVGDTIPDGLNPASLLEFYCISEKPEDEENPEYWITGTWSEKPDDAVFWCAIVSPLGPREHTFIARAALQPTKEEGR